MTDPAERPPTDQPEPAEPDALAEAAADAPGELPDEAAELIALIDRLESVLERSGLAELEERLAQAESAPDEEPDTSRLDELGALAAEARRAEVRREKWYGRR